MYRQKLRFCTFNQDKNLRIAYVSYDKKNPFIYRKVNVHPWTEVVNQNLESKNALFYIFDFSGSDFENSEKPLF